MSKITFIVYEESYLIRKGLIDIINKIPNTQIIKHTDNIEELCKITGNSDCDFIVINPSILKDSAAKKLLTQNSENSQFIALRNGSQDELDNFNWSETISVYDSQSLILNKVTKIVGNNKTQKSKTSVPEEISKREVDILKLIALGYANKEIADKLFLSTHTVVTHRKNITRKLGIKTVSGLTIYAILNKIIDINDSQ